MRREMRGDLLKRRIRKLLKTKHFKVIFLIGVCLCLASWKEVFPKKKLPTLSVTYVVVHLDFKRTPINLNYLQSLLKMLKEHGANGLLMEYEDMFPFEGNLANLSARNCYKKHELEKFLLEAKRLAFEIIPLVQTFGHLEFALNRQEFAYLREDPYHADSICPSKAESRILIMDMLEQVINFHKRIVPLKYIHIGCDEVYHMARCNVCTKRNITTQLIYLNHITTVHEIVKALSKNTTVLLWDDMLRTVSPAKWRYDFHIPVEPVYWQYQPHFSVHHSSLLNYHRTFSNIWIATAFKGADGPTSLLPNVRNRFLNHLTWLNIITNYKFGGEKHTYNFMGIIVTGWSRYNHNKPPCDLLPGSIPSLIVNLLLIQEFKSGNIDRLDIIEPINLARKNIEPKLKDSLECETAEIEFGDNKSEPDVDHLFLDLCDFDGLMLYDTLKAYSNLNSTIANGLFNATLPNRKLSRKDWCEYMKNSIKYLENDMTENMKDYYKENFVTQYVFEKIFALRMKLKHCFLF